MYVKKRTVRPRRRPARRARRRIVRSSRLNQSKVYSFMFSPDAQYTTNTNPGGDFIIAPTPAVGPGFPINDKAVCFSSIVPAASAMLGLYDYGMGLTFNANAVGSIASYTSIYDQWRLDWVKVTLRWLHGGPTGVSAPGQISPTVYVVRDYDDALPPTSAHGLARQGRKVFQFDNKSKTSFSITVRPKQLNTVWGTPVGTTAAVMKAGWNDCKNTDARHNGLKFWFQNVALPGTESAQTAFEFTYQYKLSFKGNQAQY